MEPTRKQIAQQILQHLIEHSRARVRTEEGVHELVLYQEKLYLTHLESGESRTISTPYHMDTLLDKIVHFRLKNVGRPKDLDPIKRLIQEIDE